MTNETNKIKLTLKQTKDLMHKQNYRLRCKRNYKVYYIKKLKGKYIVFDWSGKEYSNIKVEEYF